MKKIFAIVLTGVALMSAPVYASSADIPQSIQLLENERVPHARFIEAYDIATEDSTYTTDIFATASSNPNDIIVGFTNKGKDSVSVSLYRVGSSGDIFVGSFSVNPGAYNRVALPGYPRSLFYIEITSSSGSGIVGNLEYSRLY